ncbi:MAG: hypothetical protein HY788_24225 [Deltaproteobacteria bacterium]|nr:hypothetical protein [Deltaproteobacteria bacterium]
MSTLEKIVKNLGIMPESIQAEVLDYIEYLKFKEERGGEGYNWEDFSLESAMREIAEETSPYGLEDIKEKF